MLINWLLQQSKDQITGLVLDLGSGSSPSYWRIMNLRDNPTVRLFSVDRLLTVRPSVVADLSFRFPFRDRVADSVILGAVLMFVPSPADVLTEAKRILKHGGRLILYANLIFNHNPEPHDYWRFTEESLRLLLERACLQNIEITPAGGRWTGAAYLLEPYLRRSAIFAPLVHWLMTRLDSWTSKGTSAPSCPIVYVAKATA